MSALFKARKMLSKSAASSIQGTFKHFLKGMQPTAALKVASKKFLFKLKAQCAIIKNVYGMNNK